jgi:hypothetical protein
MDGVRTQRSTVANNGLIKLAVVNDDVGVTYCAGRNEVDWIVAEVGIREQTPSVPCRGVLQGC